MQTYRFDRSRALFERYQKAAPGAPTVGLGHYFLGATHPRAPVYVALLSSSWSTHRVTDVAALRNELGYRDVVPAPEALARTARWLVENPPKPGGRAERGLQDAFDYDWEDRLIEAWRASTARVRAVAEQVDDRFRDRNADGRRGEKNNTR